MDPANKPRAREEVRPCVVCAVGSGGGWDGKWVSRGGRKIQKVAKTTLVFVGG